MPYSTKQHQAVLRCLEARGENACTAAELAEDLRRAGCQVSQDHKAAECRRRACR